MYKATKSFDYKIMNNEYISLTHTHIYTYVYAFIYTYINQKFKKQGK